MYPYIVNIQPVKKVKEVTRTVTPPENPVPTPDQMRKQVDICILYIYMYIYIYTYYTFICVNGIISVCVYI
jgi:hypothetical protein